MALKTINESTLTAIANAIRSKLGVETSYKPSQMPSAIQSIITPVLESKTINANGTYTPGTGKNGFSSVTVSVSGVTPTGNINITDTQVTDVSAYATAQVVDSDLIAGNIKKDINILGVIGTYEGSGQAGIVLSGTSDPSALIGNNEDLYVKYFQSLNTDYLYGIDKIYRKVNGSWVEYTHPKVLAQYIIHDSNLLCEAFVDNFEANTSWGDGSSPIAFTNGYPTIDTNENAVSIPVKTSGIFAAVDLGEVKAPYTAYMVAKLISPTTYSRILSSMNQRTSGYGLLLYGSTINVSSWGSDQSTGVSSSSDYFVAALRFNGTGGSNSGYGRVYGTNGITRSPSTSGQYLTIARTDTNSSTSNAEPCDILVRYLAVVDGAESDENIATNLASLYSEFVSA